MMLGAIKWFDNQKGFGVIQTPIHGSVLLHVRSFILPPPMLISKEVVVFRIRSDVKSEKAVAERSRLFTHNDDFSILISSLEQDDTVVLEQGNRNRIFSLRTLAAIQFFKEKSLEDASDLILDFFDEGLTADQFIAFCSLIENVFKKIYQSEESEKAIKDLFSYFGQEVNEEILFAVWKSEAFQYLGYDPSGDYEIPEILLRKYFNKLTHKDFERIRNYSFGSSFGQ